MAEHNSTKHIPDLPLQRSTLKATLRAKTTHDVEPNANVEEIAERASRVFDDAVKRSGLTNGSISATLRVSESLVGRWRNPNAREFPNTLQLHKLGPDFLLEFNRASQRNNGLGRRALQDLLGDLALAVGE